jgi:hypothetical protein
MILTDFYAAKLEFSELAIVSRSWQLIARVELATRKNTRKYLNLISDTFNVVTFPFSILHNNTNHTHTKDQAFFSLLSVRCCCCCLLCTQQTHKIQDTSTTVKSVNFIRKLYNCRWRIEHH